MPTETVLGVDLAPESRPRQVPPPHLILELQRTVAHTHSGEIVAEAGVMAGALADALELAGRARAVVSYEPNAFGRGEAWPLTDDSVHFLLSYEPFAWGAAPDHVAREAARVLKTTRLFGLVFTDPEDADESFLAHYFPGSLAKWKATLPERKVVEKALEKQGLYSTRRTQVRYASPVSPELVDSVESRAVPGLETIDDTEFAAGLERLKQARKAGGLWPSVQTLFYVRKVRPFPADA